MKACVKSNSWPPELAGGSTLDEDSSLRLQSIDREPWGSPMASLKCRVVAANTGSFSVSNSLFLVIAAPPGAQSHCIDHFAWIIKRKANLRTNFSHELTSPQRMPISHLASQYNERSDVWWRAKGNDSWEPRELALALPAAILPFSLSLSLTSFLQENTTEFAPTIVEDYVKLPKTLITAMIHQACDANFATEFAVSSRIWDDMVGFIVRANHRCRQFWYPDVRVWDSTYSLSRSSSFFSSNGLT